MLDAREDPAALARECATWCRYLIESEPSPSVVSRYLDAHAQGVVDGAQSHGAFDRTLVRVARAGPFLARVCDVHSRLFCPAGLLRRKLVLTLALLEADRESHARVDRASAGSRAGMLGLIGLWMLRYALTATLGLLFFLPLRLFCAAGGGRARSK